ncbi:hypothetical protein ISE1_3496 [plant metagenome]|uniref:Uncharacterized protein n=1 Tax=plant metagenome TaxID=1297885 RepID=A0A484V624_9ZZZZ
MVAVEHFDGGGRRAPQSTHGRGPFAWHHDPAVGQLKKVKKNK